MVVKAGGMVTIDYPDLSRRVVMLPNDDEVLALRRRLSAEQNAELDAQFDQALDAVAEQLRPRYHEDARLIAALLFVQFVAEWADDEEAYERVCARKGLLPL